MSFDSIVAYTYQADMICVDCAREVGIKGAFENGSATIWGDCGSAEQALGEWASLIGLDRMNERSFDSDEFPKVVFSSQVGDNGYEHCGQCRECIDHDWEDCGRLDSKGNFKW